MSHQSTLIPVTDNRMITRDKAKQPFASTSIWNMPIGANAVYQNANLGWAKHLEPEIEYFLVLKATDPPQPLYHPKEFGRNRCQGTVHSGITLPIPDDFIIPDVTEDVNPNNPAAFLLPNGRTIVQVNALARCRVGGAIYGWQSDDEDIYGAGITGGHGGSGLSSIGGTIRLGELIGSEPIRHSLKINLWCQKYCSYTQGQQGGVGYRWPAIKADIYANPTTYGGQVSGLMMGSLLAIPPFVTEASLNLETIPAKKLFRAMQDYGAYVVDDAYWDAHYVAIEKGVNEELIHTYGYGFSADDGIFYQDLMKLFSTLHIVDNNSPMSVGGGGSPRVSLVPELQE